MRVREGLGRLAVCRRIVCGGESEGKRKGEEARSREGKVWFVSRGATAHRTGVPLEEDRVQNMFGDHIGCVPTSRWSVVANSTVLMVFFTLPARLRDQNNVCEHVGTSGWDQTVRK